MSPLGRTRVCLLCIGALMCTDRPPTDPPPPPPPDAAAVLVGAGDVARCDLANDEATAALLDTIHGTIFTAGDNVYATDSVASDFTNCYGPSWGRFRARTRPAVGHMEYWSPGAAAYWRYFGRAAGDSGKGYYSYELGTWHVVVLNSSIAMSAGSTQEQWLRADLATHPTFCTVAYWHMPRFSSVSYAGGGQVEPAVKPLWDDLYAAGAELVVNAHYEVYERFAPQTPDGAADPARGIREFIVGTGGIGINRFPLGPLANSEVRNTGAPGVLRLALDDGGYRWRFVPVAGETFADTGSARCHGAAPPPPVASLDVSPPSANLAVGARLRLAVVAKDAGGSAVAARAATWVSSDTTVVRVNPRGVATAWAPGRATVTAGVDGHSVAATITVTPTTATILVGAGDIATCTDVYDEATAVLLDAIPGTVFTAGDNAYPDGTATDYARCYAPSWGRHRARTRPAPGNHEYATPRAAGYFAYFGAAAGDTGRGFYSYELGTWHVVVLNNYQSMALGSLQEHWLRADLATHPAQCALAVWHEPLFSSSSAHQGGNPAVQPLWQALYEAGAEVVVTGHAHVYERFAPQTAAGVADAATGIREFTVGTGGAALDELGAIAANSEVRNNSARGVLKLTLRPSSYEWTFVPDPGQTFSDSGAAPCHGPPGR